MSFKKIYNIHSIIATFRDNNVRDVLQRLTNFKTIFIETLRVSQLV